MNKASLCDPCLAEQQKLTVAATKTSLPDDNGVMRIVVHRCAEHSGKKLKYEQAVDLATKAMEVYNTLLRWQISYVKGRKS